MKNLTIFLIVTILSLSFGKAYGLEEQKKILALYSYDATFHIYQQSVKALTDVFPETDYKIDVDFLDSKRYLNGELNQNLKERIKIKQESNNGYDLVISGNDNALNFCINNQEELFPNTPIFFWGVNDLDKAFEQNQNPWISGIAENISAEKYLTLIQQLHPSQKQFVLITDNTATCKADLKVYKQALAQFPVLNVEIVSISEFNIDEYANYLKNIPPDKIIIILASYRIKDQYLDLNEMQQFVLSNTNNIIYNAQEFGIGSGFLGGTIKNYYDMVYGACLSCKQILNGSDISHIRVIKEPELNFRFDYQLLVDRKIDFTNLPADVQLVNYPKNNVEIKKNILFIALGGGFAFLMLLIFFVIYFNAKRKFEKALRINAENYLGIFKGNHSIMLIINPEDGQIIDANEAATYFYGYEISEFKKLRLKDIDILPQHDIKAILNRFENGESYIQVKHRLKNRQIRDVELYAGRIKFNGKTYLYAIIHDISQRVKANKELIEAKKKAEESDRLKSAFLANMSHEIRTPMNSILGFSSLLEDDDFDTDIRREYLRYIQKNGEHLLKLINDIIDLSKVEANQLHIHLRDCNLNTILDEILTMANNQLKATGKSRIKLVLSKGLTDENFTIKTDEIRLKQIFLNLINNAIKFTDNGFIDFGYKFRADSVLQFYVKDTGIGIPDDKRKIIFTAFGQVEEYATRNYGGTGLGLSITRSLVEKLGGHIWVMSDLGVGSRFYFTHPTKDNQLNL